MFCDYSQVPAEWKRELRADLERDPPILGKQTLGSPAGGEAPPESLASAGSFGSSGVGYIGSALTFNYPVGPSYPLPPGGGHLRARSLEFWADELSLRPDLAQDIVLRAHSRESPRPGWSTRCASAPTPGVGVQARQRRSRSGGTDQRLQLNKSVGVNETPLVVNNGGVRGRTCWSPRTGATWPSGKGCSWVCVIPSVVRPTLGGSDGTFSVQPPTSSRSAGLPGPLQAADRGSPARVQARTTRRRPARRPGRRRSSMRGSAASGFTRTTRR